MKLTYQIRKLLEHGPLTAAEMVEIVGVDEQKTLAALCVLKKSRCVVPNSYGPKMSWKLNKGYSGISGSRKF